MSNYLFLILNYLHLQERQYKLGGGISAEINDKKRILQLFASLKLKSYGIYRTQNRK